MHALSLVLVAASITGSKGGGPIAWRELAAGAPARFASSAVLDPSRGKVIVFAGETSKPADGGAAPSFDVLHDLWEHDVATAAWQKVEPAGDAPGDRAYHAAAFDAKRATMWVYGGAGRDFKPLDELWGYDVAANRWKKASPAGARPEARISPSLAYDAERDRLVLHGGCKGFFEPDNAYGEVWTYDLAGDAWTKRAKGPARWQHAAAIAPELGLLVVQGGYDGASTPKNDAWAYDLAKDAWDDLGKGPKATDAHAAVWDAAGGVFLFHGGATPGKRALDSVWSFEPKKKRWKELAAAKGAGPGPRAYHALVGLPDGSLWVFGGTENQFLDPMKDGAVWVGG